VDVHLTLYETRILGCLVEKEITTPDQYPLSLNALTNACNQKSNRNPLLDLDEHTVQQTVDELKKKHLVSERSGFGSRVTKLAHRFGNTEFTSWKFSEQELGIICVLFLRGPQTPGELRTRTSRLCAFEDTDEVELILEELIERSDGPFVVKLAREPSKREARFAHLFSGEVEQEFAEEQAVRVDDRSSRLTDRLASLERRLDEMQQEIEEIRRTLQRIESQERE